MIAFFDASALIYLIEAEEPFASKVRGELAAAAARHPDLGSAVSRLTWLECRVGPMKANDHARLAAFDGFFARPDLVWVELTREVVELAAAIRAKHGLRTPDALQAASCLQLAGDHLFLTGDAAFKRVAGLNVTALA
ncbi:MAG: type II toxin-antitoxin system VapC family toxin [Candidatus Methylophosphatis roskildensis]